jgi:hypothetical protein
MTDNLVIAEECIDRQAKSEVLDGRNIEWATGRVLLHALTDGGHCLCGQASSLLTPTERPWSATYLPHLQRCKGCLTARPGAASAGYVDDVDQHPAPAAGIDIRTAHGSDAEQDGAAALSAVLDEYDLRRWMLTDLVIIDDTIIGGFSHPLSVAIRKMLTAYSGNGERQALRVSGLGLPVWGFSGRGGTGVRRRCSGTDWRRRTGIARRRRTGRGAEA